MGKFPLIKNMTLKFCLGSRKDSMKATSKTFWSLTYQEVTLITELIWQILQFVLVFFRSRGLSHWIWGSNITIPCKEGWEILLTRQYNVFRRWTADDRFPLDNKNIFWLRLVYHWSRLPIKHLANNQKSIGHIKKLKLGSEAWGTKRKKS